MTCAFIFLTRDSGSTSCQMGEEWDDSLQSKEQLEANLLSKHEAAIRRERALAYAFSRQVLTISTISSNKINILLKILIIFFFPWAVEEFIKVR